MYKIEFIETLKALDVDKVLASSGRYGDIENLQFLKGIRLYMGPTYYAVVRGRIPYEVAKKIYEKYPGNPYAIRVAGGVSSTNPLQYAADDRYMKEMAENIQTYAGMEYAEKNKEALKKLARRKDENKYIHLYHIDTKEGLVIFLTEMKDYYARKYGLPETEVQRFDELMASITDAMLKTINPGMSRDSWMQTDGQNSKLYFDTIAKSNQSPVTKKIRDAINKFDIAVNPYSEESIELDETQNYLSKVGISAHLYSRVRGQESKKCCELHIIDKKTQSRTSYYRDHDGFSYQVFYQLAENEYLNVAHYFYSDGASEEDKGESIYIDYSYNDKDSFSIRYNLTNGLVYGNINKQATEEQLESIYEWLLTAIECASNVTVGNMQKQTVKKLGTINN